MYYSHSIHVHLVVSIPIISPFYFFFSFHTKLFSAHQLTRVVPTILTGLSLWISRHHSRHVTCVCVAYIYQVLYIQLAFDSVSNASVCMYTCLVTTGQRPAANHLSMAGEPSMLCTFTVQLYHRSYLKTIPSLLVSARLRQTPLVLARPHALDNAYCTDDWPIPGVLIPGTTFIAEH